MPLSFDITGLILSALGTVGLFQTVYSLLSSRFPDRKLKQLDDVLYKAQAQFETYVEEGIFEETPFRKQMSDRLLNLHRDASVLRPKVHCATTVKKKFRAWWIGLSRAIDDVRHRATIALADLYTTADQERKRLEREGRLPRMSLVTPRSYATSRSSHISQPVALPSTISSGVAAATAAATGVTALHSSAPSLTRLHASTPSAPGIPYPNALKPLAALPKPALPSVIGGSYTDVVNHLDLQVGSENLKLSYMTPTPVAAVNASSGNDPRHKLRAVTQELSQALTQHSTATEMVHTPDHKACCHPEPGTSEMDVLLNVLRDLTLRVSAVAAAELQRPANGARLTAAERRSDDAVQKELEDVVNTVNSLNLPGLMGIVSGEAFTEHTTDLPTTATLVELS